MRGRRRIEAGRHRRAAVLADAIVVDRELVLRADLPDEAHLRAVDALRIDADSVRGGAESRAGPMP